uniref:Uncharacterized protein n=1 Tax=Arundo donax TaxID=35708 RepID=A0A0A9HBW0_ARUDO
MSQRRTGCPSFQRRNF